MILRLDRGPTTWPTGASAHATSLPGIPPTRDLDLLADCAQTTEVCAQTIDDCAQTTGQLTLAGMPEAPTPIRPPSSTRWGQLAVTVLCARLLAAGFNPGPSGVDDEGVDLTVNGHRVQVKSTSTRRGAYRFHGTGSRGTFADAARKCDLFAFVTLDGIAELQAPRILLMAAADVAERWPGHTVYLRADAFPAVDRFDLIATPTWADRPTTERSQHEQRHA